MLAFHVYTVLIKCVLIILFYEMSPGFPFFSYLQAMNVTYEEIDVRQVSLVTFECRIPLLLKQ